MHDFIHRPKRRHIKEIPLAPILDLLTVVIFFLILSTSFIELRQNILPPSSTLSTSTAPTETTIIPVNPKLLLVKHDSSFYLILKWFGENAGLQKLELKENEIDKKNLKIKIHKLISEFQVTYPNEKNIQLGIGRDLPYQWLLNLIDGTMPKIRDIVLIAPEDVESTVSKIFEVSLENEL
jgi:biopolymer transport protein ExbD